MKAISATGILLAIGAATPAVAASGTGQDQPTAERQICRSVSQVGTRLRTRTCMTRSQWTEMERERRDTARREVEDQNTGNEEFFPGPRPQ